MRRTGIAFDRLCALSGLPAPVAEHRFHAVRKWRWDWSWPSQKVALEQHGGVFIQGKHSRGAGQMKDFEKWSTAAADGWRVIHVTPSQLESTATLDLLRRALA